MWAAIAFPPLTLYGLPVFVILQVENIGARRLHAVIERIVEEVSFDAPELAAQARSNGDAKYVCVIDKEHVLQRLAPVLKQQDLSKYVL